MVVGTQSGFFFSPPLTKLFRQQCKLNAGNNTMGLRNTQVDALLSAVFFYLLRIASVQSLRRNHMKADLKEGGGGQGSKKASAGASKHTPMANIR